jgi:hypothetical protein
VGTAPGLAEQGDRNGFNSFGFVTAQSQLSSRCCDSAGLAGIADDVHGGNANFGPGRLSRSHAATEVQIPVGCWCHSSAMIVGLPINSNAHPTHITSLSNSLHLGSRGDLYVAGDRSLPVTEFADEDGVENLDEAA